MSYSNYYIKKCYKNKSKPNMDFIAWITTIELVIEKALNLGLLDLPDQDYMDYFENRIEPVYVINKIIKENYLIL
jgi:hypothetical protein